MQRMLKRIIEILINLPTRPLTRHGFKVQRYRQIIIGDVEILSLLR